MGEEGDWMVTSVNLSQNGDRLAVGSPTYFGISLGKYGRVNVLNHTFG